MSTKHSAVLPAQPLARPAALALLLALGLALCPGTANAQSPTSTARWSASSLRVDWKIGDWGSACGPRPSGGGAPSGIATITPAGGELQFRDAARNYSTKDCWEQFPGLTRISHVRTGNSWKNVCQTPPGDPRQAKIVTTVTAAKNQIQLDETGQYQFVLKGQNCTASVRRTRVYNLLEGATAAPSAAAAPSASASVARAPEPVQAKPCAKPGPAERLEVRPSRKLMRPGERFTFRAVVVDAAGCALGVTPTWRVVTGTDAVRVVNAGHVVVSPSAVDSEARLQASVGDRAVSVIVEIASRDRYASLLLQGTFNAEGESSEAAVARIASSSIGARSSVAREDPQDRRALFMAIVALLALAVGLVGFLVLRKARQRHSPAKPPERPAAAAVAAAVLHPTKPLHVDPPRICPTCREEFPPDAEFCAFDGNRLVPMQPDTGLGPTGGVCPVCGQGYDPGVAACPKHNEPLVPALVAAEHRRAPGITQKICPVCGTQFPGDGHFCGKCGAALVPVN